VPMGNNGINHLIPAQTNPGGDAMEPQEITMGQVTYELRRVFQGTCPLSELVAEQLVRYIPAGFAEAGSSGPKLAQNIPTVLSVDEGCDHEV